MNPPPEPFAPRVGDVRMEGECSFCYTKGVPVTTTHVSDDLGPLVTAMCAQCSLRAFARLLSAHRREDHHIAFSAPEQGDREVFVIVPQAELNRMIMVPVGSMAQIMPNCPLATCEESSDVSEDDPTKPA